MSDERNPYISTLQMAQDSRLCRLFAHVAVLLRDGPLNADSRLVDDLANDLLALAPEYVPPFTDRDHDPDDWLSWEYLIEQVTPGEKWTQPAPVHPSPSLTPSTGSQQ